MGNDCLFNTDTHTQQHISLATHCIDTIYFGTDLIVHDDLTMTAFIAGEDFCEASVREVWEETGVKSRFQSILAFRHSHAQQFGRSNLYVICLLEASPEETGVEGGTEEGEGGIRVDAEIEAAQWMDGAPHEPADRGPGDGAQGPPSHDRPQR